MTKLKMTKASSSIWVALLCLAGFMNSATLATSVANILIMGGMSIVNNGDRSQLNNFILEPAVAIKAINDVNSGNGSIVPALEDYPSTCDVKLNFTVMDSVSSFSSAIKQYNHYKSERNSKPIAILGPTRSSATIPLSFVSSADGVPIIGAYL